MPLPANNRIPSIVLTVDDMYLDYKALVYCFERIQNILVGAIPCGCPVFISLFPIYYHGFGQPQGSPLRTDMYLDYTVPVY